MTKTVVGLYDDFSTAEQVVRALVDSGFDRADISLIAQDATHGNQPPMSLLEGEEQGRSYAEGVRRGGTLVTLRAPEDRAGEAADIMNRFGPVDMPQRAAKWRATSHAEDARQPAGTADTAAQDDTVYSRDLGEHSAGRQDWSTHDRDVAGSGTPALAETELGGRQDDGGRQARQETGMASGHSEAAGISGHGTAGPTAANTRGGIAGDQDAGSPQTDEQPDIQNQDTATFGAGGLPGAEDVRHGTEQPDRDQGEVEVERDFSGVGHGEWETRDLQEIVSHDAVGSDTSGSSGVSNQDWRSRELGAGGPGSAGGEGAWQSGSSQPASAAGTTPTVTPGDRDYGSFESDFRRHHEMVFGTSGRAYDEWEPGYRYGYDLARNPQYRGYKWSEIEPAARRDWENSHPGYAWDEYRAAIRHGWERVAASISEQGPDRGDQAGFQPGSQQDYGRSPGLEGDHDRT